MSNYTCTHCGCVLEPGEEYIFDEEYYCKDIDQSSVHYTMGFSHLE